MNLKRSVNRRLISFFVLMLALATVTAAQTKRSITHNDYDSWKSMLAPPPTSPAASPILSATRRRIGTQNSPIVTASRQQHG